MLIAGGIVGVVGLAFKVYGTALAVRELRQPDGNPGLSLVGSGFVAGPMLAGGLGLIAGGVGKRGAWDAHHELFDPGAHAPMMKPRRKLGWALFGAGMGVWGLSRLAFVACPNEGCLVGAAEVGYYGSLALTGPGLVFAAYGTGHDLYKRRFGSLATWRVAPMAGNRIGLAIGGRF